MGNTGESIYISPSLVRMNMDHDNHASPLVKVNDTGTGISKSTV